MFPLVDNKVALQQLVRTKELDNRISRSRVYEDDAILRRGKLQ
jgi:hypothetical protein